MLESKMLLLRCVFAILGGVFIGVEIRKSEGGSIWSKAGYYALGAIALGNIAFLAFVTISHIGFPLNLHTTEGILLQEFQRALELKPIYPRPDANYIPWAYNPLYSFVSIPFAWIFGPSLLALRVVSVLGMLGSFVIVFLVIRGKTGSTWWATITIGLFAAAYHAMDSSLDCARPDALMVLSALLGTYLIDKSQSYQGRMVGVVVLCLAFWFKQHGALFAAGGVLFLTLQVGLRRALPFWCAAAMLGPGLYIWAGPSLFGSHFHYFTWEVPRGWMTLNVHTFSRFFGYIWGNYAALAGSAVVVAVSGMIRDGRRVDIWTIQLVFGVISGFMGALDSGSASSIFIPMGTMFILVGSFGIYQGYRRWPFFAEYRVHLVCLLCSFTFLLYNPLLVLVSPGSRESYAELVEFLESLDGKVYAPTIGYMRGYDLNPNSHWGTLQDIARKDCYYYRRWNCAPGRGIRESGMIREYLREVTNPEGPAYILEYLPLTTIDAIAFLEEYYVLEKDLGLRFHALRDLPRRWHLGWPRYLYRFDSAKAGKGREGAEEVSDARLWHDSGIPTGTLSHGDS